MPLFGGVAAGIGALLGGGLGLFGSESAADTQADAEKYAANLQNQQFQQTQQNEQPWLQAGQFSLGQLTSGLQPGGQFVTPINPTEADVQSTPGYQFSLDQGDLGIESGQAAAGGAFTTGTLKSLDRYNTGLADQTYQQVFNNQMANQTNAYNRLASLSGLGQITATQTGQIGQQAATTQGQLLSSAAASQAAGTVGGINAITGGIAGATNNATSYINLQQLLNQQKMLSLPASSGAPTVPLPSNSYDLPALPPPAQAPYAPPVEGV